MEEPACWHIMQNEPNPSEREMWTPLGHEPLDFRYVQDPVYNLSEADLQVLARLRDHGLRFGLLPRLDPTSFLRVQVALGLQSHRVEISVDEGGRYVSFLTRRSPLGEQAIARLTEILNEANLDTERCVTTAGHLWVSFFLEPSRQLGVRNSLFNFDKNEQLFLQRLELCVRRQPGLEFHIYPRGTTFGGIELMITDGRASQMVRIFVKGKDPVTYHALTENTPLGRRLVDYLHATLGQSHLDEDASRLGGKFLSLVYSV